MVAKSPARQAAIRDGKACYFTGQPCKRGHVAERSTLTCHCVECLVCFRKKTNSKYRKRVRRYRGENRIAIKEKAKLWTTANPKKVAARTRRWCRANKGKVNARAARRRARQIKVTPLWLTEVQWDEIEKIYELAAEEGLTVDHIIPLQGERVCGLHVPWNLQLLSNEQNAKKGNTF